MTTVTLTVNNSQITSVLCDGHTNYANSGEDIVCAALSSIVQTALLGLLNVAGINMQYKRDDKKGLLQFAIPQNLTEKQKNDAGVILNTMHLGVSDLAETWSDYVELIIE